MLSRTGEAGSLWQALTSVPDHRRKAGQRYPLAGLLLIAVAALLSGRRDRLGIVRWGRRLTREALEAIGISRNRVPAPSVWCELFQGLDIAARGRVLGDWVRGEQTELAEGMRFELTIEVDPL
ncbi:MAG TPA: transposase family protein, partial [Acetobacteraceae bacterium]